MKIFNFSEVIKNYLMTFIERRAAIKKCRRIIGKYVRFRFIAKKFLIYTDTIKDTYRSCRNVSEVCSYIIKEFIPVEYRAVPPGEKLKYLRERRLKRMTAARATRYGHLSGEGGFEFDGEKEKSFRDKIASKREPELERDGDFQITAKTKTVKNE